MVLPSGSRERARLTGELRGFALGRDMAQSHQRSQRRDDGDEYGKQQPRAHHVINLNLIQFDENRHRASIYPKANSSLSHERHSVLPIGQ